jgi:F0F1-type ATP synthase membrane subunit c/vacuolar-type H+-ATPase subunit K
MRRHIVSMIKITFTIFVLLFLIHSQVNIVGAQSFTTHVASMIEVSGEVRDGDLVCSTLDGLLACNAEADTGMFGVVTQNPAALIRDRMVENAHPIVSTGMARVRVSSRNGVIRKGQYITSSEIPGVAQLATENGYVFGTAMEDYLIEDPAEIGMISTVINIHLEAGLSSARSNLIAVLQQSRKAPVFAPLDSLRYFIAALLVITSFVMGFIYFGRTTAVGVEAIGRNPLAKKQIQSSMLMHFVVTFVVIGIGLVSAYFILIF